MSKLKDYFLEPYRSSPMEIQKKVTGFLFGAVFLFFVLLASAAIMLFLNFDIGILISLI